MFNPTTLLLSITALLATTQGAPATSVNPRAENAVGNLLTPDTISTTGAIDRCGGSSFNDRTSGASPLVGDCEQMARNIEGDGNWETGVFQQRTLTRYGTCAFGVQSNNAGLAVSFYVGNEDIRSLVFDSVAKFQRDGKVGSEGEMRCLTYLNDHAYVTWGLYHT